MDKLNELLKKLKGKEIYIAIAVAAVVLIVFIVGALQPEGGADLSDSQALITTSTDAVGNVVTHLYRQYSDGFVADADIPTDVPETAVAYYAAYSDFDDDLLFSLFMNGVETERIEEEDSIYHYNYADNGDLISNLIVYNYSNEFRYHKYDTYKYYRMSTENFHTLQSIKGSNNMRPLYSTFYGSYDLGFMAKAEAIAYVKENYLDILGYTVSDEVEIYSIDHKKMQEYQDNWIAESYARDGTYEHIYENYVVKETFTEEDDFYIMCFTVEQSGIRLSGLKYSTLSGTRQVTGASITVYVHRDGVIYFEASGITQMSGTEAEGSEVITAQEAMDIAYRQYSDLLTDDTVLLTDIAYEYVTVPYNNNSKEIMLVPAWIIQQTYTAADGSSWSETLSVNALTGKEIQ